MGIETDSIVCRGSARFGSVSLPNNSVGDANVNAADPIGVTKQDHQYSPIVQQTHGTATVSRREVIHVARGAGVIRSFRIGQVVANVGGATVTVTLLKNGTNILSSTLQLTNAQAAFATLSGTFGVGNDVYAADDVFEVNVTAAAGGGTLGQGFFAQLVVDEEES